MSYSQDLWNEFGSSGHDLLQNPWGETPDRNLLPENPQIDDEFGDFESAESQRTCTNPSTTTNDPEKSARRDGPFIKPRTHQSSSIAPSEPSSHSLIDDIHPWMSEPNGNASSKTRPEKVSPISLTSTHFGTHFAAEGIEARLFRRGIVSTPDEEDWGDFVGNSSPLGLESAGPNKNDITRTTKGEFLATSLPLDCLPTKAEVSNAPSPTIAVPRKPPPTPTQIQPPSNVPPPSILLLAVVETLQSLLLEIKDMIIPKGLSKETQNKLDQESAGEINHRLSMARAAARIIAGRKLRWRRDKYLSQSMKIGPANSGRAGGMKLTGIDKLENRREDGEVEEAVRTWKKHIGTLRAAVATANSRQPDLSFVLPEILETMPVRTAKPSEGALVAPKICFLCGLKRDERIEKVDVNVEDSFGEWWIDHWGHVDCKTFWEEHKDPLSQR